jgi:hypothetical protein
MPNVFQRVRDALFPAKTAQPSPHRYTTADLQRQPGYREKVADLLEHFGLKLEQRQGHPDAHYLMEGTLTDVFRNDAARQPRDGRRREQTGLRRYRERDDWLR